MLGVFSSCGKQDLIEDVFVVEPLTTDGAIEFEAIQFLKEFGKFYSNFQVVVAGVEIPVFIFCDAG